MSAVLTSRCPDIITRLSVSSVLKILTSSLIAVAASCKKYNNIEISEAKMNKANGQ